MHSFLLGDKQGQKSGFKVLVVDSDPESVQQLVVALRDRGCEPLQATSFETAKRLWIAEKPAALIADIRLGQFNGLQLLLRAKADRPDVAAVITCAFPDKVLESETQRFGGTFMVKPLTPERVLAHLLGPDEPVRLERFGERRIADRRRNLLGEFLPDRRTAERRRSTRD